MTGYATEVFEKKCYDAGMDYYLDKPITEEKIRDVLKKGGFVVWGEVVITFYMYKMYTVLIINFSILLNQQ